MRGRAGAAASIALACAVGGCIPAATWAPSLRGRVVERASGAPVPGALVVAIYEQSAAFSSNDVHEAGSALANADGRFFIPGRPMFLLLGPWVRRDFLPSLNVYYPVYGRLESSMRASGLYSYEVQATLALTREPGVVYIANAPYDAGCHYSASLCERICQHVYGRPCRE